MGNVLSENPVELMLRSARLPTTEQVSIAKKSLEEIRESILRADALHGGLLGIEVNAKKDIESQIQVLELRKKALEMEVKCGTSGKYKLLDTAALTWRRPDGWPSLAIFSLNSPTFSIAVSHSNNYFNDTIRVRTTVSPSALPANLRKSYDDVVKKLKQETASGETSTLSCKFEGVIPLEVKEKITKSRKDFEEIFIIAEPANYTLRKHAIKVRPPSPDPLVVGLQDGTLWLIAAFDVTSVEQAMLQSVNGKPPSKGKS